MNVEGLRRLNEQALRKNEELYRPQDELDPAVHLAVLALLMGITIGAALFMFFGR